MQLEMTQAEYARHRGVSRQAISKLVRTKKIPLLANGKISPAHADEALGEEQERIVVRDAPATRGESSGLAKAKTAEAFYAAQRARIKFEREVGQLVPANELTGAASACNAALVQSIDRISGRAEDIVSAAAKDGIIGVRAVLKDIARDVRRSAGEAFAKLVTEAMAATAVDDADQDEETAAL